MTCVRVVFAASATTCWMEKNDSAYGWNNWQRKRINSRDGAQRENFTEKTRVKSIRRVQSMIDCIAILLFVIRCSVRNSIILYNTTSSGKRESTVCGGGGSVLPRSHVMTCRSGTRPTGWKDRGFQEWVWASPSRGQKGRAAAGQRFVLRGDFRVHADGIRLTIPLPRDHEARVKVKTIFFFFFFFKNPYKYPRGVQTIITALSIGSQY